MAAYCPICYTNELTTDSNDLKTIALDCGHRFCSECTVEMLKQQIERADIDKIKCFDHECLKPILKEKLVEIFKDRNMDLLNKYDRFKDKKDIDSDPLIRWCTKPGCDTHIKAKNRDATKLECPTCKTEICFNCRDKWHGETVTCEEALQSQLEGWADQNKDNVSFCPSCRSKIEKNQGCNHMTCGFCEYEFCWACGQSASAADRHYEAFRGCGVGMMDS